MQTRALECAGNNERRSQLVFWSFAVGLTCLVGFFLLRALLKNSDDAGIGREADISVYKDQLREVEKDAARGLIGSEEADNLKAEIGRRLIAAAEAGPERQAPRQKGAGLGAAAVLLGLLVLAFVGYTRVGEPGQPDQPLTARLNDQASRFAERPHQKEIEALIAERSGADPEANIPPRNLELIKQLEDLLKERPEDERGRRLLARSLASLGLFSKAADAQAELLTLLGDQAEASDHNDLAEFYILAANTYVSPEAEAALRSALTLDPSLQPARYYSGLLAAQAGRFDLAYDIWIKLLDDSAPDAPWIGPIRQQIDEVALRAGRSIPPGPSGEDIAAAQDMSPEDRREMIEGMVSGLASRLREDGGSVEEWSRLIRAYGVLGETASASDAWAEARKAFEGDAIAEQKLRQAAQDAEVAQ